jgi:hypothetical protein
MPLKKGSIPRSLSPPPDEDQSQQPRRKPAPPALGFELTRPFGNFQQNDAALVPTVNCRHFRRLPTLTRQFCCAASNGTHEAVAPNATRNALRSKKNPWKLRGRPFLCGGIHPNATGGPTALTGPLGQGYSFARNWTESSATPVAQFR